MSYHRGRFVRRLTLGRYPLVSLADARARAKTELAKVTQGLGPAAERRAQRTAPIFSMLVDEYIERHAKPRKRSWEKDAYVPRRYVPAHTPHDIRRIGCHLPHVGARCVTPRRVEASEPRRDGRDQSLALDEPGMSTLPTPVAFFGPKRGHHVGLESTTFVRDEIGAGENLHANLRDWFEGEAVASRVDGVAGAVTTSCGP